MTKLDTDLAKALAEAEANTERLRQLQAEQDDQAAKVAEVERRAEVVKTLPPRRIPPALAKARKSGAAYQAGRVEFINDLRSLNTATADEAADYLAAGLDLPAGCNYTTGARRDLLGPAVIYEEEITVTVNIVELLNVADNRVDAAQLGAQQFTPQAKLLRNAQILDAIPAPEAATDLPARQLAPRAEFDEVPMSEADLARGKESRRVQWR